MVVTSAEKKDTGMYSYVIMRYLLHYHQTSSIRHQIPTLKNVFCRVLLLSLPKPLKPLVWSREWRCSWSSADRRCSNYIWVINNYIAYLGTTYITGLTVIFVATCPHQLEKSLVISWANTMSQGLTYPQFIYLPDFSICNSRRYCNTGKNFAKEVMQDSEENLPKSTCLTNNFICLGWWKCGTLCPLLAIVVVVSFISNKI